MLLGFGPISSPAAVHVEDVLCHTASTDLTHKMGGQSQPARAWQSALVQGNSHGSSLATTVAVSSNCGMVTLMKLAQRQNSEAGRKEECVLFVEDQHSVQMPGNALWNMPSERNLSHLFLTTTLLHSPIIFVSEDM
jgi:hypothetical protein